MSKLLIYTEGGTFGLGHVIRCIHLARAIGDRPSTGSGHRLQVEFTSPINETVGVSRLRQAGHIVYHGFPPADAVLVDVEQYPGIEFMQMLRDKYRRVILVGGVSYPAAADLAEYVDLMIYQGELFDFPTTDKCLNGPEYLIIDPAFAECSPNRHGHILVSMGGRDPENFTGRVLDALQEKNVKTIVGPTSQYTGPGIKSPLSLRPYVNGARLAIVTTGMTAYECLAAGVPCILFNISSDHERTAAALQERGCAYNMGLGFNALHLSMAAQAAGALWEPMSQAARALVDGKGAARVAERICQNLFRF